MSVVTHQRTEAGPCQRHGEGRHGNGAEVEDSGIDVQWRESLEVEPKNETVGIYKVHIYSRLFGDTDFK